MKKFYFFLPSQFLKFSCILKGIDNRKNFFTRPITKYSEISPEVKRNYLIRMYKLLQELPKS